MSGTKTGGGWVGFEAKLKSARVDPKNGFLIPIEDRRERIDFVVEQFRRMPGFDKAHEAHERRRLENEQAYYDAWAAQPDAWCDAAVPPPRRRSPRSKSA